MQHINHESEAFLIIKTTKLREKTIDAGIKEAKQTKIFGSILPFSCNRSLLSKNIWWLCIQFSSMGIKIGILDGLNSIRSYAEVDTRASVQVFLNPAPQFLWAEEIMPILLKVSNSRKNDMQCLFNGLYYRTSKFISAKQPKAQVQKVNIKNFTANVT